MTEEGAVRRAKREILGDIRSGRVPASVSSFSQLHDYVDANEYGGLCDDVMPEDDAQCAFANRVQDALDRWLKAGGGHRC